MALPVGGDAKLSTERSEGTSWIRGKSEGFCAASIAGSAENPKDFARLSIAPVEVPRASPESVVASTAAGSSSSSSPGT